MKKKWHRFRLNILAFWGSLLLSLALATPGYSHWADLSVAEVMVGATETQMTLTFPTGLLAFADDNRDNQLSTDEVRRHQAELQSFLGDRIRLSDRDRQTPALKVSASETTALPAHLKITGNTHSSLNLQFTWQNPIQGLKIQYDLFLPGVPTATCLATILHTGKLQNFIFSPTHREFSLIPDLPWLSEGNLLLAIAGAFLWGGMHALSPGHGKTVVGAYLIGSQATAKHALILGMTTTLAHTIGVFILGLVALFAYKFILPDQLYPWFSLLSGFIVFAIGLNLLIKRLQGYTLFRKLALAGSHVRVHSREDLTHTHSHDRTHSHFSDREHSHSHAHSHAHSHFGDREHSHSHAHHHDREHSHSYHEHHEHSHACDRGHIHSHDLDTHSHDPEHSHDLEHSHGHSHFPDRNTPVTMRSLVALGISGGLLPCPAALVLMLSAISLGQIGLGLGLVVAFSLGLAGVLTSLGLLLVSAKHLFEKLPNKVRLVRILPPLSAVCITLIGLAIVIQAIVQIGAK